MRNLHFIRPIIGAWLRPMCQLFSNQGDKHTSNVSHGPLKMDDSPEWKHFHEMIQIYGRQYYRHRARWKIIIGRAECNSPSRRCGAHMPCARIRLDISNIHGDCMEIGAVAPTPPNGKTLTYSRSWRDTVCMHVPPFTQHMNCEYLTIIMRCTCAFVCCTKNPTSLG